MVCTLARLCASKPENEFVFSVAVVVGLVILNYQRNLIAGTAHWPGRPAFVCYSHTKRSTAGEGNMTRKKKKKKKRKQNTKIMIKVPEAFERIEPGPRENEKSRREKYQYAYFCVCVSAYIRCVSGSENIIHFYAKYEWNRFSGR